MNTSLRLRLTAALVLLLLTSIVSVWAHPPKWQSPNTAAPSGAAGSEPCDLVIGPAHGWCTRRPVTAAPVTGTVSAATAIPAARDGHNGLATFATLAIAAAIALAVERRVR